MYNNLHVFMLHKTSTKDIITFLKSKSCFSCYTKPIQKTSCWLKCNKKNIEHQSVW